ncbi:SUKH-4 family immunity protein [Streptomyces sp. NPDC021218]|uniref:SUKH-4 family immunity protein n=1 Tax=Streptomyces sp. NPDC021218 TaxID=3365119 RepID=UPI0037898228
MIEYVLQVEAAPILQTSADGWLYRLTQNHHGDLVPGLQWSFGVQPGTGTVYYVLPEGEAWFANSSIGLWLRTLHHYGLHVSESEILSDPDDREDEALAELGVLADELKNIDPPAFDGYCRDHECSRCRRPCRRPGGVAVGVQPTSLRTAVSRSVAVRPKVSVVSVASMWNGAYHW